jgi:hypothetical protein
MERTPEMFSRSCFMSSRETPSGTDSRRMEPAFLTRRCEWTRVWEVVGGWRWG